MKNKSVLLIGLVVVVIIVIAGIWIVFGSNNDNGTPVEGNPIAVFDTSKGTFKVDMTTMPSKSAKKDYDYPDISIEGEDSKLAKLFKSIPKD